MAGKTLDDLVAFVAVAEARSFTAAAAKLGVSQSALSQTIRSLEARLGIRLLTRTTRSVAATEAGERLLRTVGPRLEEIDAELDALSEMRDKLAGTVRLTSTENAAETVLWPALARILPNYSDIKVEIVRDLPSISPECARENSQWAVLPPTWVDSGSRRRLMLLPL